MAAALAETTTVAPLVSFATDDGGIGTILLQRPPVNAISDAFIAELDDAIALAEQSGSPIVLLRSASRAFCAGADLKMVGTRVGRSEGAAAMEATVRSFHRVFNRLAALPAVTIAEIGGVALGGGLELALACDLRIVAQEARLGLPEAGVGLLPGAGGTQRLTRLCGAGTAAKIILAGEQVGGEEALRVGLADWCVPLVELPDRTIALAQRIGGYSAEALRLSKRCIELAGLPGPGGADAEISGIVRLMMTPDTSGRVAAFLAR